MSLFINLKSEYSFCPYGANYLMIKMITLIGKIELKQMKKIHNFLEKRKSPIKNITYRYWKFLYS